jgi:hypothetical protein
MKSTKKIWAALAVLVCIATMAQAQKDTVTIEMEGARVELAPTGEEISELLDVIRSGAKRSQQIIEEQRTRMKAINKEVEAGKMSKAEAEKQREKLVEETERKLEVLEREMEAAGESLGSQVEERVEVEIERSLKGEENQDFAEKWESEARAFEENSSSDIELGWDQEEGQGGDEDEWEWDEDWEWDKKKKNQNPTNFIFDFHLGFNTLLDDNGNMLEGGAQLDDWRSNIYEIGFNGKTRMGSSSSKAYIKYGVSFSWHDWTLRGGNVINKDSANGGSIQFLKSDLNVRHSEWRAAFVNVPIMLQLDLSERGMDNGFTLGVGGYGGLRMYSVREIKYNDFADDRTKTKEYNNLFMNNWRYGLMAQIGFNSFKITAQYDMNPLFRESHSPSQGDLRNLNLTIGWSF